MGNGAPPVITMAKRKKPEGVTNAQESLTGDRVEFQAPSEWVSRLDDAAASAGMSRSAYIRFACNKQMQRDLKEQAGDN